MKISIYEILSQPDRWENTSNYRLDGKIEYREKKEYGNRHAVFDSIYSEWGEVHIDEFNATNFPIGTVRHVSKYVEEKTGIPEWLISIATGALAIYVGYKALK